MRIADAHLFRTMRTSVGGAREEYARAQEAAGTGIRVAKPSDDPAAAAAARREASQQKLAESAIKNADLASARLLASDQALESVSDLVGRARELALASSSSTASDENRAAAAKEVASLREQLISLGNTKAAGSFVFGGETDQTQPFDADGTFTGDGAARSLELLPGVSLSVSGPAGAAFGVGGGGENVLELMSSLGAALQSNDLEGIRAQFAGLERADAQVIEARSSVGVSMQGLTVAKSVVERKRDGAITELARLTEVDEVDAITDLVKAKGALDTALAVAQKLPTSGLTGG